MGLKLANPAIAVPTRGTAFGDSFTFASVGLGLQNYWPNVFQNLINESVGNIVISNMARSGEGSGYTLAVAGNQRAPIRGVIAFIYIGENDANPFNIGTVQGGASTTVIPLDAGKGTQFPPGSFVFVGAEPSHVIASTAGDTITLATPLSGIPGAGTLVNPDTTNNIIAIGQQLSDYAHLMVLGIHYMNWSSAFAGGDTLAAEGGSFRTLRLKQQAAAQALGAVYVDLFGDMKVRILQKLDAQGSASWLMSDGDTHLNDYGESIVANCVYGSMPVGWMSDFL